MFSEMGSGASVRGNGSYWLPPLGRQLPGGARMDQPSRASLFLAQHCHNMVHLPQSFSRSPGAGSWAHLRFHIMHETSHRPGVRSTLMGPGLCSLHLAWPWRDFRPPPLASTHQQLLYPRISCPGEEQGAKCLYPDPTGNKMARTPEPIQPCWGVPDLSQNLLGEVYFFLLPSPPRGPVNLAALLGTDPHEEICLHIVTEGPSLRTDGLAAFSLILRPSFPAFCCASLCTVREPTSD